VITVLDSETTGLDPTKAAVVEIAAVFLDDDGTLRDATSTLVNPQIPIPPEARAIHHISDKDVANAPILEDALKLISPAGSMAAHNAAFDAAFLKLPIQICTWRCAKHIWPFLPSHGNGVLRYALPDLEETINKAARKFDKKNPKRLLMPPHRALPDAWVTAGILQQMLEKKTPKELIDLTQKPILLRLVHFGKHKGQPWETVPKDYLKWLLRQDKLEPDVRHTAQHWVD